MKRKIIKSIIIIPTLYFLITFIFPAFVGVINIGNILGIIICISLLLITIFAERIIDFLKEKQKNKRYKTAIRIISVLLIFSFCCFSASLTSIIVQSKEKAENANTLIVLGCAVKGDTPSVVLKGRVNAAYDYLYSHPECVAILSGGQGNGESISEAQCMYNMLTDKGIDCHRLYKEENSISTKTNIEYSKEIIEENNLDKNIAVVSSDYHLKRAKMICKEQGLEVETISSPSIRLDKNTFYLREVLGVIKEYLF